MLADSTNTHGLSRRNDVIQNIHSYLKRHPDSEDIQKQDKAILKYWECASEFLWIVFDSDICSQKRLNNTKYGESALTLAIEELTPKNFSCKDAEDLPPKDLIRNEYLKLIEAQARLNMSSYNDRITFVHDCVRFVNIAANTLRSMHTELPLYIYCSLNAANLLVNEVTIISLISGNNYTLSEMMIDEILSMFEKAEHNQLSVIKERLDNQCRDKTLTTVTQVEIGILLYQLALESMKCELLGISSKDYPLHRPLVNNKPQSK